MLFDMLLNTGGLFLNTCTALASERLGFLFSPSRYK